MCGRFSLLEKLSVLVNKYEIRQELDFEWKPSYNIAPGESVPIVIREEQRTLALAKWGLVPSWKKENEKNSTTLINARAETINEKPLFRAAYLKRRCLVPFSNFFEWQKAGGKSTPYYVGMKNIKLASFGGIFEINENMRPKLSFSIITTEPNSLMKPIHNRMPLIIGERNYSGWLESKTDPCAIAKLLQPYPADGMKAYEVSPKVNSPKNVSPEIILPVQFTQKRL